MKKYIELDGLSFEILNKEPNEGDTIIIDSFIVDSFLATIHSVNTSKQHVIIKEEKGRTDIRDRVFKYGTFKIVEL